MSDDIDTDLVNLALQHREVALAVDDQIAELEQLAALHRDAAARLEQADETEDGG